MTITNFLESLIKEAPDRDLSQLLQALWWDKKGDWDRAHSIAQIISNPDGSWVHAYLHRVEGDDWNASYWYNRANRKMSNQSLDKEWNEILEYLLEK